MAQYKAATAIAVSTRASSKNKGVMIVNDGTGATEADINLYDNGEGTTAITVKAATNHNPIIIPAQLYSTGDTGTGNGNCTVYELS